MADYFGLPPIVSLILLIFPFCAWFCGLLTRINDKHFVAAIIRFFFGFWIIWVLDVIFTIMNGCNGVQVARLIKM